MMCKSVRKHRGFHKIKIIAELEMPAWRPPVLRAVSENCAENDERFRRFMPPALYNPNSVLIRKVPGVCWLLAFTVTQGSDTKETPAFKTTQRALDCSIVDPYKKQLFPDHENYAKAGQQRFELVIAHWDVPVETIPLN